MQDSQAEEAAGFLLRALHAAAGVEEEVRSKDLLALVQEESTEVGKLCVVGFLSMVALFTDGRLILKWRKSGDNWMVLGTQGEQDGDGQMPQM
jgi:hypothetical protein